MNTVSSEEVLVLADDPNAVAAIPDSLNARVVSPDDAEGTLDGGEGHPDGNEGHSDGDEGHSDGDEGHPDGDEDRHDGGVWVVVDTAGIDRLRECRGGGPTVAFVDDPTGTVATDPAVDAVATTPVDLESTVRWLAAREEPVPVSDDPPRTTSRLERLNEGAARLASVRSAEAAHRAVISVVDEVFPASSCVIGVRDGARIEPVAASADVAVEDCDEIRTDGNRDAHIICSVGDDTVFRLVPTDEGGFDATDRRLAELLASHVEETLDRIRVDETLRTERDHLLALFSNVPDPAIAYDYVDGEPIVHRVNDAFEETFGYDAETVVGASVDDYILPPNEEAESEATELNDRLQRGENVRREVTRATNDGLRHFILHVVPIWLDVENVSGYAIYTDVTERRERESTLRRQNERLDEFASIVSHDLRNPLSVAEGYVELAKGTDDPSHLDAAADALDRMDELVGDLLSLARQGRAVGETEHVSVEALARDAWENVDTGGAELIVEDDVTLDASPTRTRELLENVFRNSAEHGRQASDSDGPPAAPDSLTVRVGATTFRGGDVDGTPDGFFVEDDGSGLPQGETDRIFESGFTTDESGTGLGLAISERIAEAHGWEIRALAGESGGARFEFRTG
ncbi:PAS domain-containing sensor histidine kinase [Halorubrum trueperi]|uniref:histidine kinase n=1 Tax=Halorubrum trueperi TaxID=2004704 RepID=A0ABD5UFG8_9EURY